MHSMPIIGIVAWMFLPLPVLFYRLKAGRNSGGIIMVACIAVLIIFTGDIAFNLLYFGFFLMTGFFLGEYLEKMLSIERIMLYTGGMVFGIMTAAFFIYSISQNQNIGQLIAIYIKSYQAFSTQFFSETANFYPQMDVDLKRLELMNSFFILVLPAIFINAYVTMMWLNLLYIKKLLFKKGIAIKSLENLNHWKAPDLLILCVIASSILLFIPIDALQIFGANCLFILMFVYFLQGISVVSFFFDKKRAPFILRFFFYIFITIQPLFMCLVIGFGLFDNWFNFRKLDIAT